MFRVVGTEPLTEMWKSGSTAIDATEVADGVTIARCYEYLLKEDIVYTGKGEPKNIFCFARDQVAHFTQRLSRAELLANIYTAACEDYPGVIPVVTEAAEGCQTVYCLPLDVSVEDIVLQDYPLGPISITVPAYYSSVLWTDASYYAECLRRYRRDYVEICSRASPLGYSVYGRLECEGVICRSQHLDTRKKAALARKRVARLCKEIELYQRIIDSRVKKASE